MLKILKSTDKAVMVKNEDNENVWLPKSKIDISREMVTHIPNWLKQQNNIVIKENVSEEKEEPKDNDILKFISDKLDIDKVEKVNNDYCFIHRNTLKPVKRKLYNRKTGKLKGYSLINYKTNIYRFSKVDDNSIAVDLEYLGNYNKKIKFEENIKNIESKIEKSNNNSYSQGKKVVHKEFNNIKICIENDIPVYLYGPTGSGKNHTLQQIAFELDLDFYFTNSIQQEFKLTGFIDAGGKYHQTEFYKAFKNGGLFFLDEMDASIPEVLVLLNAAIANKYFEFPNGRIEAHKDFRVVSAGNTVGDGADELYVGRLSLDQATLDRFVAIKFDYDRNIEMTIAKGNSELVDFIRELRKDSENIGVRATFSYRAIITVTKLEGKIPLDKVLKIAVFKGIDKDTLNTLYTPSNNKYYQEMLSLAS